MTGSRRRQRLEDVPGRLALDNVSLELPRRGPRPRRRQRVGQVDPDQILAGVYRRPGRARSRSGRGSVGVADLSPDWARTSTCTSSGTRDLPAAQRGREHRDRARLPDRGPWAIRKRFLRRRTQQILDRYHIDVRPTDMLLNLGPAQRAMVAIARALQDQDEHSGGVLVLDEPTASLPEPEVETLLGALRVFARSGQSVLFVSHRTPEVLGFATRVTVLRDGKKVATVDGAGLTEADRRADRRAQARERSSASPPGVHWLQMTIPARAEPACLKGVTMDLREREVQHRGPRRLRTLGAAQGPVRCLQGRQRGDPARRQAGSLRVRARGNEPRLRLRPRGPHDRGVVRRTVGAREPVSPTSDATGRHEAAPQPRGVRRQGADREYGVRTSGGQAGLSTLSGGNQQRSSSPAGCATARPAARRADARRRHRRAHADLQAHRRGGRGGTSIILVSSDNEELALLADRAYHA